MSRTSADPDHAAGSSGLDDVRVRYVTFRDRPAGARAEIASTVGAAARGPRVLVETCHRVELVGVGDPAPDAAGTTMIAGEPAVRRVFEVIAGFDSAILAEEQILGQARRAYEAALRDGVTGPILNELFRRALRFGRRVRSHARPGGDRSLADRAAAWLRERLPAGGRVAVVGTGEMGRLLALHLAAAGHAITVVSRSAERGGRLMDALPGRGHRVVAGQIDADVAAGSDAIVLALRAREPMLTAELLGGGTRPWTVDLCVPAAVEAGAAALLGERLHSIDDLGRGEPSTVALDPAIERRLRAELEAEVEAFAAWVADRRGADAVAVLRHEAESVRRRHLERLGRRAGLSPEQAAAVEATSAAMLAELLHRPSVELRRGGADAPLVRRLFGLDT